MSCSKLSRHYLIFWWQVVRVIFVTDGAEPVKPIPPAPLGGRFGTPEGLPYSHDEGVHGPIFHTPAEHQGIFPHGANPNVLALLQGSPSGMGGRPSPGNPLPNALNSISNTMQGGTGNGLPQYGTFGQGSGPQFTMPPQSMTSFPIMPPPQSTTQFPVMSPPFGLGPQYYGQPFPNFQQPSGYPNDPNSLVAQQHAQALVESAMKLAQIARYPQMQMMLPFNPPPNSFSHPGQQPMTPFSYPPNPTNGHFPPPQGSGNPPCSGSSANADTESHPPSVTDSSADSPHSADPSNDTHETHAANNDFISSGAAPSASDATSSSDTEGTSSENSSSGKNSAEAATGDDSAEYVDQDVAIISKVLDFVRDITSASTARQAHGGAASQEHSMDKVATNVYKYANVLLRDVTNQPGN